MTSLGIKRATFRLVAQCLNQVCYRMRPSMSYSPLKVNWYIRGTCCLHETSMKQAASKESGLQKCGIIQEQRWPWKPSLVRSPTSFPHSPMSQQVGCPQRSRLFPYNPMSLQATCSACCQVHAGFLSGFLFNPEARGDKFLWNKGWLSTD
jgi:hypothetical protein